MISHGELLRRFVDNECNNVLNCTAVVNKANCDPNVIVMANIRFIVKFDPKSAYVWMIHEALKWKVNYIIYICVTY